MLAASEAIKAHSVAHLREECLDVTGLAALHQRNQRDVRMRLLRGRRVGLCSAVHFVPSERRAGSRVTPLVPPPPGDSRSLVVPLGALLPQSSCSTVLPPARGRERGSEVGALSSRCQPASDGNAHRRHLPLAPALRHVPRLLQRRHPLFSSANRALWCSRSTRAFLVSLVTW